MPKYVFAAGPRHRRHWLQTRPRWVIAAACVLWAVPMLVLWIKLAPDVAAPPEAVAPVEVGVGGPGDAQPSASGGSGPSPAGGVVPRPGPTGGVRPGVVPTGAGSTGPSRHKPPAGAPTSRPPVGNIRDPEPTGPHLTVSAANAPSSVDLSAEGVRDWIHWGLDSPGSINRKAGARQAISDEGGTGPRERYDANGRRFSWRDGAPRRSATNVVTGIYAVGLDSGFRFSVEAGPRTRTLRLYAGVLRSQGRLEVSLPSEGLSRSTTLSSAAEFSSVKNRFTITFRAPAGGRLQVRWIVTQIHHRYGADVSMQAATLR